MKMQQAIDQQIPEEIRAMILDFFSEECDVDRDSITVETDIIKDLEGDSLMLLSLLEIVRKKYRLSIDLKTLGKHLMKKPANTIGQVIDLTIKIVKHGDDILSVEL